MTQATTSVEASPTKAFFVRMLTRDIDLADAILDLLDNCVDGVLRLLAKSGGPKGAQPYTGYRVQINATPDFFEILDNCGGIPEGLAAKYAFMLGRPDPERDSDIETVGVYGIGMKRAVFKLGRHSVVTSQPEKGAQYEVEIPATWLSDDNNWKLEMTHGGAALPANGTRIVVTDLHEPIKRQFDKERSTFLTDLQDEVAQHYAIILRKGLEVVVNNLPIKPADLMILSPKELGASDVPAIEPYVFIGTIHGVNVEIAVGFYRALATEDEASEEDATKESPSRKLAGWTIVCNDRVVLFNDKTAKTGWGTRGIPSYHNQFISIAGTVTFRSNDSERLPLNTTKRGIDASSEVYLVVLESMCEGLKKFTQFTYWWKQRTTEAEPAFQLLKKQEASAVMESARRLPTDRLMKVGKLSKEVGEARRYIPHLPKPEEKERTARIIFSAEVEEIEVVADYYFGRTDADRSEVGKKSFAESLAVARKRRS